MSTPDLDELETLRPDDDIPDDARITVRAGDLRIVPGRVREDLVGKAFGRLTVVAYMGEDGAHRRYWNCRCSCGSVGRRVCETALIRGASRSCGCITRERGEASRAAKSPIMRRGSCSRCGSREHYARRCALPPPAAASPKAPRYPDLVGLRVRMLTVIGKNPSGRNPWRCRCDCGKECFRSRSDLTQAGGAHSCGCYKSRSLGQAVWGNQSPEYRIYRAMILRCFNRSARGYARYGGRGITVCDRWRESFAHFLADVGARPSPGHSIDRIDNDGNYEPGNVRWATNKEQQRNRHNTRYVTIKGVTKPLTEWTELARLPRSTVEGRLRKGHPPEACFKPPQKGARDMGRPLSAIELRAIFGDVFAIEKEPHAQTGS